MPAVKKQKVTNTLRTVAVTSTTISHPLNVRPLGNMLLSEQTPGLGRAAQMGHFACFPEELLMELLGFVDDAASLMRLSHTSRVMYAYVYDEDLWKRHYTQKLQALQRSGTDPGAFTWRGSWRLSVLGLDRKAEANVRLPDNLLCSDILYRPFQCAQVDYDRLFAKVVHEEEGYHLHSTKQGVRVDAALPPGRIPRLPEQTFSQAEFDARWSNRPFILTNSDAARWPRWNLQSLLDRFAGVKFRQEAVQWPLSLYSQYLAANCDESPLYLFDCSSVAMRTLRREYAVPQVFQQDLFTVFGECRPDHAWVIIGSLRSGSTFHKDPNYTSAWNAALSGRKLWVMFPPGVTPPGVSTDDDESEVTSPVGIAEWVLSGFYNDAAKMPEAQIAVTFPGECMHVPSGWWHSVINLDDSVALTQNLVPSVKLGEALYFLKNKTAQISGFRPLQVRAMLQTVMDDGEHDADMAKIADYAKRFDDLNLQEHLQNEDCGEILQTQLPPMPVFELFKKLLQLDGKTPELEAGLRELERKEKSEQAKLTGKSEAWAKLTEGTGFSFGFDVE